MSETSDVTDRDASEPRLGAFSRRHLEGALALFAAEGWETYTADAERTYRALSAPDSHGPPHALGRLLPCPRRRSDPGLPSQKRGDRVRKLSYSMTLSLDGYIVGPRGEFDWSAPSEELFRFHTEHVRELGLHLLGRRLYEVMAYWETAEERNPSATQDELEFARIWKELPKIVYSKGLEQVEGNTRLSGGDPVEEVRELKQGSGADIAVGGATLASTLTAAGLVDEYLLFLAPVVLGGGRPFFAGDARMNLELVDTRTFGSGVTYLRYRRV